MRKWNQKTPQLWREWIALQAGDSLLLRGARGLRVDATLSPFQAGRAPLLWLTEEGELDDVFLRPGDCHVLRGNGRMVATAWGPISLRVVKATARELPSPDRAAADAGASAMLPALAPRSDEQPGCLPAMRPAIAGVIGQGEPRLPAACCGA